MSIDLSRESAGLTWDVLDERARGGDVAGVTALLLEASEEQRLAFGAEVRARFESIRPEDWWWSRSDPSGARGLAVLASQPSAARTASLLLRPDMRGKWAKIPVGSAAGIARARRLPWLADLGRRLFTKLDRDDPWRAGWPLIAALMTEAGTTAPVTPAVVRGWLSNLRRTNLTHLDVMLPALFEFDELGSALSAATVGDPSIEAWREQPRLTAVIAELTVGGRLDRKVVLGSTVDRLARGGRPSDLRGFLELHEALAPTAGEVAALTGDYARMLTVGPSTVASLAQETLRATGIDLTLLLEISEAVLVRKEKGLVKRQRAWLTTAARRDPSRAAEVAAILAAAEPVPAPVVPLPARLAAGPMPAPITGVAELAGEIAALRHDETAERWERILAALVTLRPSTGPEPIQRPGGDSPAALRHSDDLAPLRHLLDQYDGDISEMRWPLLPRYRHLNLALHVLLAPDGSGEPGDPQPVVGGAPDRLLDLRVAEVAARVRRSPVPLLLSTPTHRDGNLAAETLVARLRQAAAEGWEPWPIDFEQALIRLPRGTDASVAGELTCAAGRQLSAWLAGGGLPDPMSTRLVQSAEKGGPPARIVVDLTPARPGRPAVEEQLLTLTRYPVLAFDARRWITNASLLAAALPHHREVSAAWSLSSFAELADRDQRGGATLLPALAERDGPFGAAMSLAVAYALSARHEVDRTAAVDAFLLMAAEPGASFGSVVGRDLGDLAVRGFVKLNRTVLALTDAHRAGASRAVGDVIAAALPVLLSAPPRGLADLLALGCEVAMVWPIPALDEFAAGPGSTRLVREARRLRDAIYSRGETRQLRGGGSPDRG
ncbi:hypothetical protein [Actinoplanes sp. NPDC023714]|uniref:hypothetical protein n=1 Tax=Actinoplanes sp. NPDC023714 TaxID=3154322 RepID=UPI0033E4BCA5